MVRVPYDNLYDALTKAMKKLGLAEERAALCARLFAETTRDGVYTHGLNRFPRFAATVRNGSVDVRAEPTKTAGMGSLERWDGHRGVGNLNAYAAMHRAIALAKEHGIGGVALANASYREKIVSALKTFGIDADPVTPVAEPAEGAIRIAFWQVSK